MKRWFMTIPEACSLVLKAGGMGENGRLYLLDMGEPVLIKDMAEQMIRFYGFEPDKDIRIEYIGTRPGERLDERLWAEDEEPLPTGFNRILEIHSRSASEQTKLDVEFLIEQLYPIVYFDPAQTEKYRDTAALQHLLQDTIPSLSA
jgi:FlaA1/EpsC-like NDP-sugar epimerase